MQRKSVSIYSIVLGTEAVEGHAPGTLKTLQYSTKAQKKSIGI